MECPESKKWTHLHNWKIPFISFSILFCYACLIFSWYMEVVSLLIKTYFQFRTRLDLVCKYDNLFTKFFLLSGTISYTRERLPLLHQQMGQLRNMLSLMRLMMKKTALKTQRCIRNLMNLSKLSNLSIVWCF